MALNIPMPGVPGMSFGRGMDAGSAMMSRIMQPILERERQKQMADRFQQEMAFRKQQAARSSQNDALQRAMMQQQLIGMQHKNDPMYEINQYKALEEMLKGKGMPSGSMPSQEIGEGMGALSSQGLSEMQNSGSQPSGGIDLEMLKNNPLLRGFAKKHLGYDPLQGEGAYQGAAREAYDLERLRKQVGEDNPVYQNALQAYHASQKGKEDLSSLRKRTLGGLKPGERWMKNEETGEVEGKEIPLTATERKEYKGRGFFNQVFPQISQGLSPFSGKGSYNKFQQAASEYETNPDAKKMIDDFLLGKKLLTAGVVKEAATLGSGTQKSTYGQLRDSLDSSDIPKGINNIVKQFQLPSSASRLADARFLKIINEATEKGEANVPAFQKQYFNPEKRGAQKQDNGNVVMMYKNGQSYRIPASEAEEAEKEGYSRGR